MEFVHEPVLLQEVLQWMDVREGGVYADGTLGGGGHSGAILRASEGTATLYGIDRDPMAIAAASERLGGFAGFHALRGNFHDGKALLQAAGATLLDGVLLDLGVSSPQLDKAASAQLLLMNSSQNSTRKLTTKSANKKIAFPLRGRCRMA